jgi:hypothetical protein
MVVVGVIHMVSKFMRHEPSGAFPGRQSTGLHKPVLVSFSCPLRPRSRLRLGYPHLGLGLRPRWS